MVNEEHTPAHGESATIPGGPSEPMTVPADGSVGAPIPAVAGNVPAVPVPNVKRRYRRRLSNLKHVRTALADCVRGLEDESLDPHRGRALVYALSELSKIITTGTLDERLTTLEKRLGVGA